MDVGITRTVGIPHKIRGHGLACVAVEVEAHFLSLRGNCQSSFARCSAVVSNDALQKVEKGKVVSMSCQLIRFMEGAHTSLLKKNELLGRSFAQRARPKVEGRGEKLARDITNLVSN